MQNIEKTLADCGQSHIFKALMALPEGARGKLQKQIEQVNWAEIPALIRDYVQHKPVT